MENTTRNHHKYASNNKYRPRLTNSKKTNTIEKPTNKLFLLGNKAQLQRARNDDIGPILNETIGRCVAK